MNKIQICSLTELVTLLQNEEIDLDCSIAIISSSYPLSIQHRPVSLMRHVACTYQDIDFDFRAEGLSPEAAAGFAEDIKRCSSTIRDWYFVSDRGVRRSAAICCAALRYWGQTEQEMAIWSDPEREPNISVYIRMCQTLGVPIGNIELNRRIYANHTAIKSALHMVNSNNQLSYDEEAAEVLRMKAECDRMAHEMLEQIDALLMRIDAILRRDREQYCIGCGRNLSLEEQEFLRNGNQRLVP